MTKEQIQNELDQAYEKINKFENRVKELQENDKIVRERFAIVLDIPGFDSKYGTKETPSWSEIFFSVGGICERSKLQYQYLDLINTVKWLKEVEEERQMKKRERRLKNGKN